MIETRTAAAEVIGVDELQRVVTVIAVPWNERTSVIYQGADWYELFSPGAFDDVTRNPSTIRVNRDHDKSRTVGKVLKFVTNDPRGLVAEIRIAQTTRGDETLALAAEDCVSVSIGFGVPSGGQTLDRKTMTRRIKKAHLDHISFVESPAYAGARVVGVRSAQADLRTVSDYLNDPVFIWTRRHLRRIGK